MVNSFLTALKEVLASDEGAKAVRDFKSTLAQGLKLSFVNGSFWIFISIVIQLIEGSTESSFKCGEIYFVIQLTRNNDKFRAKVLSVSGETLSTCCGTRLPR